MSPLLLEDFSVPRVINADSKLIPVWVDLTSLDLSECGVGINMAEQQSSKYSGIEEKKNRFKKKKIR